MLVKFLGTDYLFKESKDWTVARILVRLNLREQLYQSMNIRKDKGLLVDLEYEGIPFWCNR